MVGWCVMVICERADLFVDSFERLGGLVHVSSDWGGWSAYCPSGVTLGRLGDFASETNEGVRRCSHRDGGQLGPY